MIELLEMCGYETAEAEADLPRIKRAFDKLGITDGDIERGQQRLAKYYDIELKGVRKIFRLCLRELVNSVLAREDGKRKVIFGFMAPLFDVVGAAAMAGSPEVLAAHQCWAYLTVVSGIFGKNVPVLEAAERCWLKAGTVAHCANVKTLVGLMVQGRLPRPDLLVSTGYSCETAPKTLDLLHELYGIPVFCFDTCVDRAPREYDAESQRMLEMAALGMRTFTAKVGEVVGFEITDDTLRAVLAAKNEVNEVMDRLRDIRENSDPLVLSATHDSLLMALNSLTLTLGELPEAADALNTLCAEIQARVDSGVGVVAKGAPRVLTILPAHHADPRLEHLVGELGISLAASDFWFMVPYQGDKSDPYVEMSQHLQGSMASCLSRRIPLIIEGCRRLKIDGLLNTYHVGCRTVAGDAVMIGKEVGRELGIPVLSLEWENFDSRVYNQEQYQRRLEVFKSMMDSRR